MSIRWRLVLAFTAVGVFSAGIFLFIGYKSINQIGGVASEITSSFWMLMFLAGAFVVLGAIGLGVILASNLTKPIHKMIKSSDQVTLGNLKAYQPTDSTSELGDLSRSVYAMIMRMGDEIDHLQQQHEVCLRQTNQQNDQWEAAAQIGREVTSPVDIDLILEEITRLISDRFGYYHVGVFLIDEVGESAVLRASSSPGGKRLLSMGFKYRIGEKGMVGYVAQNGKPRISRDVASDHFYSQNAELPDTRSEATLPFRYHNQVIGILDVHAITLDAFGLDDLRVLQIIADQLALGIVNTRLQNDMRQLRDELEQVYGHQVTGSWERHLRGGLSTYYFNPNGVESETAPHSNNLDGSVATVAGLNLEKNELTVPLTIRDQVIGSIYLRREAGLNAWTEDDLRLVQEVLEQISPALESARILEETQARVMQEQAVNIISNQVRRSAGFDAILQNTVRELGRVLGGARTFIQLSTKAPDEQAEPIPGNQGQEDGRSFIRYE